MVAAKRGTRARGRVREDEDDGEGEPRPASVTEERELESQVEMSEREPQAQVRRVDPVTGRMTHLDSVALANVSEEWLAETYGGGKYTIYKRGMVDGKWQYAGYATYEIDESLPFKGSIRAQNLRKEGRSEDGPRVFNPDGSEAGGSGLINAGVFSLIKASQDHSQMSTQFFMSIMQSMNEDKRQAAQLQMEMLRAAREDRKAAVDIPALLTALAPLLAAVLPMFQRKELSPQDIIALVQESRPKDQGEKLSDTLELLTKLREAMGDSDGGNSGSPLMSALTKALDVLPTLMSVNRASAPAPAASAAPRTAASVTPTMERTMAGVPSLPVPPGMPSTDEGPLVVTGPEDVWGRVEPYIGQMQLMAAMGRNASRIAATVWEFAPPNYQAVLTEVLADENFTAQFLERFPQMQSHRVWTNNFVEALRFEAFGDEGDDTDDDPPDDIATDVPKGVAAKPEKPTVAKKEAK